MSETLQNVLIILAALFSTISAGGVIYLANILSNRQIQDAAELIVTEALPENVIDVVHQVAQTAKTIAEFAIKITDGKPNDPPSTPPDQPTS